jgi:hypothetical protein
MNPEEYMEQRLQDQIDWYDRKSASSQKTFKRLRTTEIVAAALIPFLSGILINLPASYKLVSPIVIGVLGIIVTVIAGVLSLGRYQERWVEYRATCESLKREKYLFQTGVEPYDTADAFRLLVQRTEELLSKENSSWTQYTTKPEREKAEGKT